MSRSQTSLLCFLLLAGAGCGDEPRTPAPAERPDVVLVLFDTFRPDYLGRNGYRRTTAPFLEDLMTRSAVFENAYSTSSWTAPATGSVFTSLYPTRHGVIEGFLANRQRSRTLEQRIVLNRLPAEVPTLPELLSAAGYATFGLASNINVGDEIGFDRGFDRFERLTDRSAERLAAKLESWREDLERGPSFVYLHFNDVHEPYDPRAPWYEESDDELARMISAYDSEISFLDRALEKLYRDFGWDRNTLLMIVSDHGEEFKDHGKLGHGFSLWNELMRVLMVVSGPDLGIPAREVKTHVSLVDVVPTILDLLGLEVPDGRDGRSLAPLLAETPSAGAVRELEKRTIFAHRIRHRARAGKETQHMWAAVRGPWKLIDKPGGKRLYHLERDPAEKDPVGREHRKLRARLVAELEAFRAGGFRTGGEQTEVEIDQKTYEQLKTLGYVE